MKIKKNNKKNPSCPYCQNKTNQGRSIASQTETKKIRLFLKTDNYQYFHCQNCHLIFLFPQPTKKNSLSSNRKMYGKKDKINGYFQKEKYYRQASQRIIDNIKKYKKDGRFLDVGCFCGLLLEEARKQGFKIYGVEKEKLAAKLAQKRLNINIIDQDFEQYRNGHFDVITLIDVLEHLPNLRKILIKIRKMLNKNGILYLQSPNIEGLMFRLTKGKWNWLLPPNHLYQFSTKSLKKILRENGFNILSVKTYDDISEFAFNLIDALGIKKRNMLEKIIWKSLRISLLILLQLSFIWSYFGYGGSINIIAQKKYSLND